MSEYRIDRCINFLKSDRVFYLHSNGAQSPICLPLSAILRYPSGHYKWYSRSVASVNQQTSSPRHIACPVMSYAGKGLVALGIIHVGSEVRIC